MFNFLILTGNSTDFWYSMHVVQQRNLWLHVIGRISCYYGSEDETLTNEQILLSLQISSVVIRWNKNSTRSLKFIVHTSLSFEINFNCEASSCMSCNYSWGISMVHDGNRWYWQK